MPIDITDKNAYSKKKKENRNERKDNMYILFLQ